MRLLPVLLSVALLAASPAANLAGTWQGEMNGPGGHIRRIMEIVKVGDTYRVAIHSIDETDVPIVTQNVTVTGSNVAMKFDMNTDPWFDYHRIYTATLSADRTALTGKWTIPFMKAPLAMNYHRVAHATWPVVQPKTTIVQVDTKVRDEVLDWGGIGTPIVLLAGLGNTGHDFFGIVGPLTKNHHVYSITRRGFGRSSSPAPTALNYSADRLGDDVIAVMDKLHIERPILIGHSIAGEELSDIGTRYANRVSALIYLEAAYWYAYSGGKPNPDAQYTPAPGKPSPPPLEMAFLKGEQSFNGPIDLPILAIYAYPNDPRFHAPQYRAPSEIAKENAEDNAQITTFAKGQPTATVIRMPHASHFVYVSNKAEVLRAIDAFIAKLPKD